MCASNISDPSWFLHCYTNGRLFLRAVEAMNLTFNSSVLLFVDNISCCFRAFCMVRKGFVAQVTDCGNTQPCMGFLGCIFGIIKVF